MDKERLQHGTAVIKGELGGARPHASLAALIAAVRDMAAGLSYGKDVEWTEAAALAVADVDSALERGRTAVSSLAICKGEKATLAAILAARDADLPQSIAPSPGERKDAEGNAIRSNAAWRAMATAAVAARDDWHVKAREATEGEHAANARANVMENRYRAESLRCNELAADVSRIASERDALQDRNNNQAITIRTYEEQNAAAVRASLESESELAEARALLKEWHGRAARAEAHCARFQNVAFAVGASPIGELPDRVRRAYSACTDRGAELNAAEREAATLKEELSGTLESVAEGLIDESDAMALIRAIVGRMA